MTTKFKTAYGPRNIVVTDATGPARTKQAFAEECDVNSIMQKYQKEGVITHVTKHQANYGFASSNDFRESVELMGKANDMFAELPSSTRKKFDGSVENFLDWVQDPENASQLDEMGALTETPAEPSPAVQPPSEPPASVPPTPPE